MRQRHGPAELQTFLFALTEVRQQANQTANSLAGLIQNRNDNCFKGLFFAPEDFAKVRILLHLCKYFFSRFRLQKYNCFAQLICARCNISHTSLILY